jgi:hypothetical protein
MERSLSRPLQRRHRPQHQLLSGLREGHIERGDGIGCLRAFGRLRHGEQPRAQHLALVVQDAPGAKPNPSSQRAGRVLQLAETSRAYSCFLGGDL